QVCQPRKRENQQIRAKSPKAKEEQNQNPKRRWILTPRRMPAAPLSFPQGGRNR
ncbi:Hypothetical predicted protein, partial [Pelobates cultripes]